MPEQVDRDFDAETRPKTFKIRDHVFTLRAVRPERWAEALRAAAAVEDSEESKLDEIFAAMDDRILLSIVPEEHDEWRALRADEKDTVELKELQAIRDWLTEVHTGRPPQSATDSSPGPGTTEQPSTARSSSQAVARPR